ncbi:hypothetical protein BGX27_009472, partial [Mortierella sp. AM989]
HPVSDENFSRPYIFSPTESRERAQPRLPPELVDDTEEWEVERIQSFEKFGKTPKWLVLWKGYPLDEAIWEPRSSLAKEALAEFEASHKEYQ